MMAGKGFDKVYNLSGGIKAWNNEVAIGPQDIGLELFTGQESAEETIIIGFGLEHGLREFYLDMKERVSSSKAQTLFNKLADIEILHQQHLLEMYQQLTGSHDSMEDFKARKVQPSMEGGLTTEQYLNIYRPDLESEQDILSLAMAIEAQALDLYQRAADRAEQESTKNALQQIANEERAHIARLAKYIDEM